MVFFDGNATLWACHSGASYPFQARLVLLVLENRLDKVGFTAVFLFQ